MQGIHDFIPTNRKIEYLNQLLKVGFDTLDFGSFVSPKAIPQMADTADVLKKLDLSGSTKLLAIVANIRGAENAIQYSEISYLGFPLSLSETFQQRNTNRSIEEALQTVEQIQNLAHQHEKLLVTYLSMGFGNPYNDPYDESYVLTFVEKLAQLEIPVISLADTIGVSKPDQIQSLFSELIPKYPQIEFGAHLHSNPKTAKEKIDAVIASGCQRIDGALQGFGGCPMAEDELVGNMATETILSQLEKNNPNIGINKEELKKALDLSSAIFNEFH